MGDNPTYNTGAIENANMALTFYPDFECWFYIHTESVPKNTIETLTTIPNTKIICKEGDLLHEKCKPRMWRFESIDDAEVEIMISRDTDTRITWRDKYNKSDNRMYDQDFLRNHILSTSEI